MMFGESFLPRDGRWAHLRALMVRSRELRTGEQVWNASVPTVNLTPLPQAPADEVGAGWAPTVGGQAVPLLWERHG